MVNRAQHYSGYIWRLVKREDSGGWLGPDMQGPARGLSYSIVKLSYMGEGRTERVKEITWKPNIHNHYDGL